MATTISPENRQQMQTTCQANRVVWPDIIRIVAVFAMIMLHSSGAGFSRFGARTVHWQVCNFYDSLSRFCVPIFVMVSGMFLLRQEHEYDLKKLYFSKILRIATAYLFWATFYSVISLDRTLEQCPNGHFFYALAKEIVKGHYHLWFLWMISGLYIVTPFLRLIAKDEKLTIYFLVLGLVFVYGANMFNLFPPMHTLLAQTINRLNVTLVAGYTCYFLWGYWLSRHSLTLITRRIIYILGVGAAIGTVVLNGLAGYHFNFAGMWMYNNLLPNIMLMTTAIFVFCQYHFQGEGLSVQWKRIISLVGRYSFGIYLVHVFFLENLYRIGLPPFFCHPVISIPITTVAVFCLSLVAVFALDRIPILNKYVM